VQVVRAHYGLNQPVGKGELMRRTNPHGISARYFQGCRCSECTTAVVRYNAERTRARKSGEWRGLVSAEKAREHLKRFRNLQAVADVMGVHWGSLGRIRSGKITQIRKATEDKILALTSRMVVDRRPFVMADGVCVSAKKTRRLVDQLRDEGYTKKQIAALANVHINVLIRRKKTVRASTEMKIKRLYSRVIPGKRLGRDGGNWKKEAA
jgi:hypothetical protein